MATQSQLRFFPGDNNYRDIYPHVKKHFAAAINTNFTPPHVVLLNLFSRPTAVFRM